MFDIYLSKFKDLIIDFLRAVLHFILNDSSESYYIKWSFAILFLICESIKKGLATSTIKELTITLHSAIAI